MHAHIILISLYKIAHILVLLIYLIMINPWFGSKLIVIRKILAFGLVAPLNI
jgi:hypothetical protein